MLNVFDDAVEVGGQEGAREALEEGEDPQYDEGLVPVPVLKLIAVAIKQEEAKQAAQQAGKAGEGGNEKVEAIFEFGGDRRGPKKL